MHGCRIAPTGNPGRVNQRLCERRDAHRVEWVRAMVHLQGPERRTALDVEQIALDEKVVERIHIGGTCVASDLITHIAISNWVSYSGNPVVDLVRAERSSAGAQKYGRPSAARAPNPGTRQWTRYLEYGVGARPH
jgi:hypothetical protein